ncbi:MAG: SelB C-terminal domain-containing protein [Fimbriimonadaceae bacterium]|nr:SelB C-terminal domain-containing protein [Fimbriimonadaceae bacterium]
MRFDVVAEAARHPEGVMTASLAAAAGRDVAADLERAKASGQLVSLAGLWLTPFAWQSCSARLLAAIDSLHARDDRQFGWPPQAVAETAGLAWGSKPSLRGCERLQSEGRVRVTDGMAALASFRPRLSDRQEKLLAKVKDALVGYGLDAPDAKSLAADMGLPRPAVEDILRVGVASGDLVQVGMVAVPRDTAESVARRTGELFGAGEFSLGEWRDATGVSRRVAVAWLEEFDRWGWTVMEGDTRRLVRRPGGGSVNRPGQ